MLRSFHGDVYLALGATDLRKSIDGLATIVLESFNLDPFSRALFVFCNRKKDKIKILYFEHSGFWLYYKRLEKGIFRWPVSNKNNQPLQISPRELTWLLDGLSIQQDDAHEEVVERIFI
jgi:transposase